MNSKVYRQYDSRWGNLAYPTSNSTVSSDGCGLCSVTHCAIELNKYKNSTPKDFISFMKQYAVAGNGTRWDGIDAGLNKFIGNSKRFNDMASFWKEVSKGNRVGVILFRSGYGPDKTIWTSSGHYVAFVSYKYENNKHWLYMKDSGPRCHDGFFSYEDSMKGCIQFLWTAEIPKEGWQKENNNWYYYRNGVKLENTWIKDTDWYYLDATGKMLRAKWVRYKDDWYYINPDGKMAHDAWAQDNNKDWFYLDSNGKMVKSKWIKWKRDWFYFNDTGAMAYSVWQKDSKGWCYLRADGTMAVSSWIKWKDNWYYIDDKGHMVVGDYTIDGKTYTFDKSGKLI